MYMYIYICVYIFISIYKYKYIIFCNIRGREILSSNVFNESFISFSPRISATGVPVSTSFRVEVDCVGLAATSGSLRQLDKIP